MCYSSVTAYSCVGTLTVLAWSSLLEAPDPS